MRDNPVTFCPAAGAVKLVFKSAASPISAPAPWVAAAPYARLAIVPVVLVALRSNSLPEAAVEVRYKPVPEVRAEALKTKAEAVVVVVATELVKV